MKKPLLLVLPIILVTGCLPSVNPSTSTSSDSSSSSTTQSSSPTTSPIPTTTTTTGSPTTTTTSTTTTTTTTTSTSQVPPVIEKQTIHQIKQESNLGNWVKFDATYLRCLTWTNEDLMYFADATDTIWLRVPYASYTGYLANRYRMKEYTVTAVLTAHDGVYEVEYDSAITVQEAVVNLGDDYPLSYNKNTTPVSVSGIAEIKAKSGQIVLNNKGHGAGELVKFTSQVVQTEYTDANKKAMVLDPDGNTITVIGDDKKMVNESDIGKYYTWVGIISVLNTVPAIMGIECEYVAHTSVEESTIDVDNATEVTPSYFKKWNLLSTNNNKRNPASNDDYYKLYKATGYLKDNSDYTTGTYHFGIVDNFTDSLSDQTVSTSVAGFYLLNYLNLDDNDLQYYPIVQEYADQNKPITVYFAMRSFNTNDHLWQMMVIEGLVDLPE